MIKIPYPIPYQGSKRLSAKNILPYIPTTIDRLIEPFAGSAAITLASAVHGIGRRYLIGESLMPLAELWKMILDCPDYLATQYQDMWLEQRDDPRTYYLKIRSEFNLTHKPEKLLYLLSRCVKAAVRFNTKGEFNQSADHRRLGRHPDKLRYHILKASELLFKKCTVLPNDYREVLLLSTTKDLIYMDPPYEGISKGNDRRYYQQLDMDAFVSELERLNRKNIKYLLSLDGQCGDKVYGTKIPSYLGLTRLMLNSGRSAQSTLLGKDDKTIESLYLSPNLKF